MKFFVYIVESPSAPDLYHRRSEGDLVAQALTLDGIPSVVRMAINEAAFKAALTIGLPESMKVYPEYLPILHFSTHGGVSGLQLSDESFLSWSALRELLIPINESLDGTLLLCMSSCEGFHACQMAMSAEDGPHPYLASVGHRGKPTWSDTAVAYSAFYHLLFRGKKVREAVDGMKAASGNADWVLHTAEEMKQGYLDFVKNRDVAEAQRALEQRAEASDLPPDAKALEMPQAQEPVQRSRPTLSV